MQERQRIKKELQTMQQECVKDYLQGRLQEITTKEVIEDILSQFMQNNNGEFMESISDSIMQAKEQNRMIKKQLQNLKITHKQQLQAACQAIRQQYHQAHLQQLESLRIQVRALEQTNSALQKQVHSHSSIIQAQQSQSSAQIQRLKQEIIQTKKSSNNFKESCEKIINECNRQKDRQKQRLVQEWRKTRQDLQKQIHQLSTPKVNQEELLSLQKQVIEKEKQIILLKESLKSSALQLQQINQLYTQSTNQYGQARQELSSLKQQLNNALRTLQSSQVSLNYLKEENDYLREEILSFSTRYEQAQKDKAAYLKEIQQGKEIIRTIDAQFYSHRTKRQQQEQEYKHKYETTITQTLVEVGNLKEQISKYSTKITEKDNIITELRQQYNKLIGEYNQIQANMSMLKQEFNLKVQTIEVHQLQIQHYQGQITNMQQQHRKQMQEQKYTLQRHWNTKNQQLIQEKYASLQLQSTIQSLNKHIASLKTQINRLQQLLKGKEERQKYYSILNQQICLFNKKLSLPTQPTYHTNNKPSIYFHLAQMHNEIKYLQQQNKELRISAYKSIQDISYFLQSTIAYNFAKEYHNHISPPKEVNLKRHIQLKLVTNSKDESYKTSKQKISNDSSNFNQIKKALKGIHQRYQTVQSQNKFYSTHLESLIKKT